MDPDPFGTCRTPSAGLSDCARARLLLSVVALFRGWCRSRYVVDGCAPGTTDPNGSPEIALEQASWLVARTLISRIR